MKLRCLFFSISLGAILQVPGSVLAQAGVDRAVTQTPFCILENKGQIRDQSGHVRTDIDYRLSANGVSLFVGHGQLHYQWTKADATDVAARDARKLLSGAVHTYRMDVELIGANRNARVSATGKTDYAEHYYLTGCGNQGLTAHGYQKITYKDIYPSIDWIIYVKDGKAEYDFKVRPGGNIADIKLRYSGAETIGLRQDGSLVATTPMGSVTEQAPSSYQEDGRPIVSCFAFKDQVLSFKTAPYTGTLVIDPTLVWGTYYGGDGVLDLFSNTACDKEGNAYICAQSTSTVNIATAGAYQVTLNGTSDAYIVKFNRAGIRQWGTYFGGPEAETTSGLACDTLGHVYLSGSTGSLSDISSPGSHQPLFGGGGSNLGDTYLAQFSSTGVRNWATYYGGTDEDYDPGLASDGANIFMCGITSSTNAITTPGCQQELYSGGTDLFLAKFNSAGTRLWGTYYGGPMYEYLGPNIGCDHSGNVYVVCGTASPSGIATAGSFQSTLSLTGLSDAALIKFNGAGVRQWGTYYGGPADESIPYGSNVSCDANNNVYFSGYTTSTTGIATPGSFQDTYGGIQDGFFVKFDSIGNRQWASYYGGTESDACYSVVCGSAGDLFLTGNTQSLSGMSTPGSLQPGYGGGSTWLGDAFIARFDLSGNRLWASYYGSGGDEVGVGAYDPAGYLYLGGGTTSVTGIATPGSHQETFPGGVLQVFLARFCFAAGNPITISGEDSVCAYSPEIYSVTGNQDATAYIWDLPSGWVGSSATDSIYATSGATGGNISVRMVICGDTSVVQSFPVFVRASLPAIITFNGSALATVNTHISYQWLLDNQAIGGATQPTYTPAANGDYTVITTDAFGCRDTSAIQVVTNVSTPAIEQLKASIAIYPNPAGEIVYIQSMAEVQVSICSMDGKLVLEKKRVKSVDLSGLSSGIYILRIASKDGVLLKTEKLTKVKP